MSDSGVLRCARAGFAFFGGVFPVLVYENLTAAVRKVFRGRDRLGQEEFRKLKAYHSFEARLCNPDSGLVRGGLGLVIVKRIAEHNGGMPWFKPISREKRRAFYVPISKKL